MPPPSSFRISSLVLISILYQSLTPSFSLCLSPVALPWTFSLVVSPLPIWLSFLPLSSVSLYPVCVKVQVSLSLYLPLSLSLSLSRYRSLGISRSLSLNRCLRPSLFMSAGLSLFLSLSLSLSHIHSVITPFNPCTSLVIYPTRVNFFWPHHYLPILLAWFSIILDVRVSFSSCSELVEPLSCRKQFILRNCLHSTTILMASVALDADLRQFI